MVDNNVKGYAGKFLRVDMAHRKFSNIIFNEQLLRKYIGGTGIGARVLYSEVSPKIRWSDPENRLVIASGPLGGTTIGGSGTISVVTKGSLTDGAAATQANGNFGAYLKLCGFDGIVIHGSASRWMYLCIDDDGVELREASHLLGRDTYETKDLIEAEMRKNNLKISVASIGPAGENLVRFAGIFIDKGHAAAHNGVGAVMGSKKLKAILVVRGKKKVQLYDAQKVRHTAAKLREEVKNFRGTVGGVYRSQKSGRGTLPIKNYLTNIWNISDESLQGFSEEYIRKNFQSTPNSCWACGLTHSTMMKIKSDSYEEMLVEEPEYEQLAAWGPVVDVKDVVSAFKLSSLTDRLGLENNESGWLIGWLMECYEKGIIKENDLDGLELNWGNAENIRQLLYMVANRVGCGNFLAEGVMRASKKVGGIAAKSAIYTMKGNTPRGHDHRTRWTEMFDTCTSNTGTLETGGIPSIPELIGPGYPKEVSSYIATSKGNMVFEDSLGVCRFNTRTNIPLLTIAVRAATGWDFTENEAKNVGLRAVNLLRVFNLRCGLTKELDFPSERYGSVPVDGPSKGIAVLPHWDFMLENYYKILGWDSQTGKPLKETLSSLDLKEIIPDIY